MYSVSPDTSVSERDYARKIILNGKSSKEIAVGEIMTTEVIHTVPNAKARKCLSLMTKHHFSRVFIDKPLGLVPLSLCSQPV